MHIPLTKFHTYLWTESVYWFHQLRFILGDLAKSLHHTKVEITNLTCCNIPLQANRYTGRHRSAIFKETLYTTDKLDNDTLRDGASTSTVSGEKTMSKWWNDQNSLLGQPIPSIILTWVKLVTKHCNSNMGMDYCMCCDSHSQRYRVQKRILYMIGIASEPSLIVIFKVELTCKSSHSSLYFCFASFFAFVTCQQKANNAISTPCTDWHYCLAANSQDIHPYLKEKSTHSWWLIV